MRLLLYGINYAPELVGVGKYTTQMSEWLGGRGHDVRVVTAHPYYPAWKVGEGYRSWRYAQESFHGVEVYRCPLWVPKKPNGTRRLLHLLSFALTSIPVMVKQIRWRPEVVLVIEPPLFCAPVALLTARISKAKAWLHIQDYEVEAFFGLGFSSIGILKKCVTAAEGWLMRRFDRVSSISRRMVERLAVLGIPGDRASVLPNWVDTDRVRPVANGRNFREEWDLGPDRRIVLYAGSMGSKQELGMVLEAAKALEESNPDLLFLLVGEGPEKARLLEQAGILGLRNVLFQPPQPQEDFPSLLTLADLHLVVQRRDAADAFMPSKLADILAAGGTAIVTADEDSDLGRLVIDNPGIAVLVPPGDRERFQGVLLATLAEQATSAGTNQVARKYAERHLSMEVILSRLESILVAETGSGIRHP